MAKAPKKIGRPSKRTPEVDAEIVKRLSNGEPLAIICRDDHLPHDNRVRDWAKDDTALSVAIAHARETGENVIAWRARQTLRGKGPEEGGESTGDTQRDKAIAEFDLKLLAKWNPKAWGDKQLIGSDPDNPLPPGFTVNLVRTRETT
jgi:hypothetical protein